MAKRLLILEDGTIFEGQAFGADVEVTGEIVFNTGMTGYQESITDQSYNGQILTFTYPLVGNYGVNRDDTNPSLQRPKVWWCQKLAVVLVTGETK